MNLEKFNPINIVKGFTMGCADIVPGVSGGTVALITGIYQNLLEAIQSVVRAGLLLIRFKFKEALNEIHFSFLIPLFIGIITAFLTMAKVITYTMENYPEYTWASFLGMMIASLFIVKRMVKKWNFFHITLVILSSMVAYLITTKTPIETPETTSYFFFSGFIAIIAMILPGISGSFLLLIMGKYHQVIGALKGVTSGEVDQFIAIAIPFAIGCGLGLALFSWILKFLLKHYNDMTFSILLGLMIGSLHKLWPFRYVEMYYLKGEKVKVLQDNLDYFNYNDPQAWIAIGFLLISFTSIYLLDKKVKS